MTEVKTGLCTQVQFADGSRCVIMAGTIEGLKRHFERICPQQFFRPDMCYEVELRRSATEKRGAVA